MKSVSWLAIVTLSMGILAGCGGGETEVTKEEDAQIRDNFSRELTPDEVSKMGGGTDAGVKPPEKK